MDSNRPFCLAASGCSRSGSGVSRESRGASAHANLRLRVIHAPLHDEGKWVLFMVFLGSTPILVNSLNLH